MSSCVDAPSLRAAPDSQLESVRKIQIKLMSRVSEFVQIGEEIIRRANTVLAPQLPSFGVG